MCPTSNRRTKAVPTIEEHPALQLLQQDVVVTINTDNPGLFAIDLTHELEVSTGSGSPTRTSARHVERGRRELRGRRHEGGRPVAALRLAGLALRQRPAAPPCSRVTPGKV